MVGVRKAVEEPDKHRMHEYILLSYDMVPLFTFDPRFMYE